MLKSLRTPQDCDTLSVNNIIIGGEMSININNMLYRLKFDGSGADPVPAPAPAEDEIPEIKQQINNIFNAKKLLNMDMSQRYYNIAKKDNYNEYYQSKAVRLENCSTWIGFAKINGHWKAVRTNLCRVRLCPMCQYKRSLAVYRNVRTIYDMIKKDIPRSKFLFATFTVRNVPAGDLRAAIDQLNYSVRKLMQYKAIKKITLGTVRTIEITYNKRTGTYHPHVHMLIHTTNDLYCGRNYITQKELTDMWAQVAKLDYVPQVDIRQFKGNTGRELAEIAKYAVKATDYVNEADSVIITLDDVLHKRHLITMTGTFKEYKRLAKIADLEYQEANAADYDEADLIIYKWHFGSQSYKLAKDIDTLLQIGSFLDRRSLNR